MIRPLHGALPLEESVVEEDLPKARLDFREGLYEKPDDFISVDEASAREAKREWLLRKQKEIESPRDKGTPVEKLKPRKISPELDTEKELKRLNEIAKWVSDKVKDVGAIVSSYGLRYIRKGNEII